MATHSEFSMRAGARIAVALVLLAGGLVVIAALAGRDAAPTDELWDYPDLEPPSRPREPDVGAPNGAVDTRNPIPLELLLEPRAALVLPRVHHGDEQLLVDSRSGTRAVPTRLAWRSGIRPPRTESVTGYSIVKGLPRGLQLIEVTGPDGTRCLRIARPDSLLELDWAQRIAVSGTVYDAEGRALADAEVRVGARGARTDPQGRFRVAGVPAGSGVPIRVAAKGWASQHQLLRIGRRTPELRFVLKEAWSVQGVLHGPRSGARIAVLPGATGAPASRAFPFYWAGRYTDVPCDAEGRFVIEGLPRDVPITIDVLHATWVLEEPVEVRPPRSKRRSRVTAHVRCRSGAVLRGVVRTRDGDPLPGARLATRRAHRRRGSRSRGERFDRPSGPVSGWLRDCGATVAESAADGTFAIGLPFRRTQVRVEAEGFVGEGRVLSQRAGQTWHPRLVPARAGPTATEHRIVAHFLREGGAVDDGRPLRIQIRWAGRVKDKPFLHDPAQPLELPALPRPAIVAVGVRSPGQTAAPELTEVRVRGRTTVPLRIPGR